MRNNKKANQLHEVKTSVQLEIFAGNEGLDEHKQLPKVDHKKCWTIMDDDWMMKPVPFSIQETPYNYFFVVVFFDFFFNGRYEKQ